VRKTFSWIAGFALTFGVAYLFMAMYAVSQPSIWLPILFSMAFWGILSFSPRVDLWTRFGLALVFASGSCLLWMASGSSHFFNKSAAVQAAFQTLLAMGGAIGLLIVAICGFKGKPNLRPALSPIAVLMIFGWLISYFSSTRGGATPMVDWFVAHLGFSRPSAEVFVVVLRKTIHFSFYGAIALAGYLTAFRNGASKANCYWASMSTALVYACFDEIRQSTQLDRGGSAYDVALDMAGAVAAVLLVSALAKSKSGRRPKTARNSSTL
jgi:VanZ family protein